MAKKKEEKKVAGNDELQEVKKTVRNKEPQEEKEPVLKLVVESGLDAGIVSGALNSKGLYLQFIEGLTDVNKELKLTRTEFNKIIEDFRNGEL